MPPFLALKVAFSVVEIVLFMFVVFVFEEATYCEALLPIFCVLLTLTIAQTRYYATLTTG